MPTLPALHPAAAGASRTSTLRSRLVVDAPTRMFHWLFALSFVGAYLTADGERWRALHVTLGYTFAGLLLFRVLYGLVGPRQARLGLLWRRLAGAPNWLRSAAQAARGLSLRGVDWRQGLNLATALAVAALLALVVPLTLSGYGTYEDWGRVLGGDWLEEVHEFFGEAFLAVVLAHLGLIAALSLLRRRNQALPMLTGRIEGAGPDLVKRSHAWLAALLPMAVLAFALWQWQQAPHGLLPAQGGANAASHRHHDDSD